MEFSASIFSSLFLNNDDDDNNKRWWLKREGGRERERGWPGRQVAFQGVFCWGTNENSYMSCMYSSGTVFSVASVWMLVVA